MPSPVRSGRAHPHEAMGEPRPHEVAGEAVDPRGSRPGSLHESLLGFCKPHFGSVKIGKIDPFCPRSALAQLDCGASDHARDHRVPQAGPGRPGAIRRPVRQRVPAPPSRRVSDRSHRRRAQDRPRHPWRVRRDHRPVLPQPLPHGAAWDAEALNERRLGQLQKDPSTRYSDQGVIPIDNTLIDRDGLLIPDAGWYWDHAEERNKIAQDYLFVNYVCTSGKHYPLEFRLFRKEDICEALKEPFRNHTALCCELIDWVGERQIPGDFAFDCYFTNAEILNHIDGKSDRLGRPRGYVGDLKTNRKLEWKGRVIKANELAASIPVEDRKELRIGDRRQWSFTVTVRIPDVTHKVRIVILWRYRH